MTEKQRYVLVNLLAISILFSGIKFAYQVSPGFQAHVDRHLDHTGWLMHIIAMVVLAGCSIAYFSYGGEDFVPNPNFLQGNMLILTFLLCSYDAIWIGQIWVVFPFGVLCGLITMLLLFRNKQETPSEEPKNKANSKKKDRFGVR